MNALKDKRVGVLMGGFGGEREVSLNSGTAVLEALDRRGYQALAIDVGRDLVEKLRAERVEVAFVALHGPIGEDGIVQAILEFMEIPYTGSGVLSSALCMDKVASKQIFEAVGIPTAPWEVVESDGRRELEIVKPPMVIKPVGGGSSLAVTIVPDEEGSLADDALERVFEIEDRALAEKYIPGKEITVGVIGGEPLGCVEIRPKDGFYDYENKYTPGRTEYIAPAPIDERTAILVRELGARAYGALQCDGAARVDFRLHEVTGPVVLEVNTIPGLTSTSLLPKSAKVVGMDFDTLVERMLADAGCKRKK